MTDIVERLMAHTADDHERLTCAARYSACSCGYTDEGEKLCDEAATELTRARSEIARLREALDWIAAIADMEYEHDDKLRSQGARTLIRISDRARLALSPDKEGK
jgi:hypothetical protein